MKLNRDDGHRGRQFEKLIETSFDGYAAAQLANLARMPIPTKVAGQRKGRLIFVQCGKAPFDVYGYTIGGARFIGAELKAGGRKESMAITNPKVKKGGLQLHQLDALAEVAQAGGIARLVWDNGGDFGILCNDDIVLARDTYLHALTSESSGRKAQSGAKSIKWERFTPVDYQTFGGVLAIEWLRMDLAK